MESLRSEISRVVQIQIGGQAQKESIMGGIIIFMTPAPIIDPFPAWKPSHPYAIKTQ